MRVEAEGSIQIIIAQLPPDPPPTQAQGLRLAILDVAQTVCGGVLTAAIIGLGSFAWHNTVTDPEPVTPKNAVVECVQVLEGVREDANTNPDEVRILLAADPNGQTLVTEAAFISCGLDGQIADEAKHSLPP